MISHWASPIRVLIPLLLLIALWGLSIQGGPSIQPSMDQPWQLTSFTESAGLTRRFIFGIDFEKDGTTWIAAADGLYRYDGYQWTRLTQNLGLPSNFIRCVKVTKAGTLWIGSDRGAGTYDYRHGAYQSHGSEKGLPGPNVRRIFEDSDGTLWFCCDRWPDPSLTGGLASFKDGAWKIYGLKEGLPSDHLLYYMRDSAGNQFAATTHGIAQKDGGIWRPLRDPHYPAQEVIWQIQEGPKKDLFAIAGDLLWIRERSHWGKNMSRPGAMYLTRENELISTEIDEGRSLLFFLRWNGKQFVRVSAGFSWQPGKMIEMLQQSPDGAVWAVGYNAIIRWEYQSRQWQHYRDLPAPQFSDPSGRIWFADNQSIWVKQSRQLQKVGVFHGPIYRGQEGSIWAIADGQLTQVSSLKEWRTYGPAQTGLAQIEGNTVDRSGKTWFFGRDPVGVAGLSSFAHGSWAKAPSSLLKDKRIVMISPDWKSGIWISFDHLKEKKVLSFTWMWKGVPIRSTTFLPP